MAGLVRLALLIFILHISILWFCDSTGANKRKRELTGRIFKKYLINENEHREYASIRLKHGKLKKACSGVFIANDTVLTPVGCFENKIPRTLQVAQTIWHPEKWKDKGVVGIHADVKKLCTSPLYMEDKKGKAHHDYAIIILKQPIERVEPITPYTTGKVGPGLSVVALGEGSAVWDADTKPVLSYRALALPVKIKKCQEEDRHPTRACMEVNVDNLCFGDLGGPLVTREQSPKLVGIVSYIEPEESCEQGHKSKSIFANVRELWPSIEELTRECKMQT